MAMRQISVIPTWMLMPREYHLAQPPEDSKLLGLGSAQLSARTLPRSLPREGEPECSLLFSTSFSEAVKRTNPRASLLSGT